MLGRTILHIKMQFLLYICIVTSTGISTPLKHKVNMVRGSVPYQT